MAWLPFYADEEDFRRIEGRLNEDDDVAFVVSDGPGRWRAVRTVSGIGDSLLCVWHVPSGPLPLFQPQPRGKLDAITDPWSGWTELSPGADPTQPYFGPGHPGVIRLDGRARSTRRPDAVGLSSFGWIGNHNAILGNPAPEAMERFWKSLGRWVRKSAVRIPREGPLDGPGPEIWAFPSALAGFRAGQARASNPEARPGRVS